MSLWTLISKAVSWVDVLQLDSRKCQRLQKGIFHWPTDTGHTNRRFLHTEGFSESKEIIRLQGIPVICLSILDILITLTKDFQACFSIIDASSHYFFVCNVWCIKNRTKLSSVLLLSLVRFLMHQTLFLLQARYITWYISDVKEMSNVVLHVLQLENL